jgi:hypothetical protein
VAAAAIAPKKTKPCEEGASALFFLGVVGPCFCWGFWRKRVVGRGFLVVKLWWIAGESWEVDGQDSGSKNMPPFPDLFLWDSHFGNLVRCHRMRRWYQSKFSGKLFAFGHPHLSCAVAIRTGRRSRRSD